MISSVRRAALVAVGAMVAGCIPSVVRVQIRNPVIAGVVDANRVVIANARGERESGTAPGSLNQEASLVSFEARGACFQVRLRTTADEADWAWFAAYTVTLAADGHAVQSRPVVTVASLQGRPVRGRVRQRDAAGQWIWAPGPVTVVEGGGTLCFPNDGTITPRTRALSLDFHGPSNVMEHRFTFEWELLLPRGR